MNKIIGYAQQNLKCNRLQLLVPKLQTSKNRF